MIVAAAPTSAVTPPDQLGVDALPVAVVGEDLAGRITSWNPAAAALYRLPAELALGTDAEALLPDPDGPRRGEGQRQQAARDAARAGTPGPSIDTWQRRPDGTCTAVSLAVAPLHDASGRLTGLVSCSTDIGERVQAETELEQVRRAAQRAVQALHRSNRDLEQFAYVASHDLSEPLRVMTGYVQLLEKRYADVLDERGRRYVFHVVDGSKRMRTLIDDLLEYSRFLRRTGEPQAVDGAAVAGEVVRRLSSQIRALEAEVVVQDVPELWADASSVAAVLQNLVSNALKFARPGARPQVVVGGHRDGAQVVLTVDDAGIGIEPEYRERVFRMFSRLHLREDYEGTGIGLAIVQQVAESHGGSAWVEDSPLGGCRFCVQLPATAQAAELAL